MSGVRHVKISGRWICLYRAVDPYGQLKARLRPMRGLKRLRSAQTVSSGHAFVQNIHRGHCELGVDTDPRLRVSAAFTELAPAV